MTSTMPDPVNEDQPRRRPRLIGLLVLALCVGLLGFAIVSLSVGSGTRSGAAMSSSSTTTSR